MKLVKFIAALDDQLGIAKSKPGTAGVIPWDLPSDKQYFRDKVSKSPVVMGWNTFRANRKRPYGTGLNTVITDKPIVSYPGVNIVHSVTEFFESNQGEVWVAGGGQIFKQALPYATHLYLTQVEGDFDCDIFFPEFKDKFVLVEEGPEQIENGIKFRYQLWQPKNTEQQTKLGAAEQTQ